LRSGRPPRPKARGYGRSRACGGSVPSPPPASPRSCSPVSGGLLIVALGAARSLAFGAGALALLGRLFLGPRLLCRLLLRWLLLRSGLLGLTLLRRLLLPALLGAFPCRLGLTALAGEAPLERFRQVDDLRRPRLLFTASGSEL